MEILKIIGLSVGSIIILFILTKIMGQREMSQLSIFDYFITITIGSIAAEMSTSLENNFIQPVVAMIVYAVITLIVSFLNTKFVKLRPILSGKTLILYDNGTLFKENFKKAKIDLNEFLVQCRTSGFFNLSDIKTALLEENGKISFLPYSDKRPSNPSDFNMKPKEDEMFYDILIEQAPTEKEKNIIKSIREDERKHNQILRRLYYEFTGQVLPIDILTNEQKNNMDYKSNLEKALFGELDAVAKYRKILGTMPSGNSYTLLMSIMTDELRHASKYNFLIQNVK